MSTKIDSPSAIEPRHGQATVSASTSSSFSSSSPKVSMFGAKSGFVIPKNKLSGSLVPIFRGGGKVDIGNAAKEESTKQIQRKTKWGTDLTQDAAVRKGKALAYQTRVEQITQQLKSGSLEFGEEQGSDSYKLEVSADSAGDLFHNKSHKAELLELERRELIGEVLRLNPGCKVPSDYKPLLKESKVPIPIKAQPRYNFIGLLLGPESNTQKQLEEETGAKVRVYGTNSDSRVEREITKSDVNEAQDVYEELYVHVSGDTYEKVDAAVALIELLLTPVSDNNAKDVTSSSVNNADVQTQDEGSLSFVMAPMPNAIQAVPAPSSVPVRPGQPLFQPFQPLWFPGTTPNAASHPTSVFLPPFLPSNPTSQFPFLRATSSVPQNFTHPPNFGPIPRVPSPAAPRPQPSIHPLVNQSPSVPVLQPFTVGPMATGRSPAPVNPQIGPFSRALLTPPLISSGLPRTPIVISMPGINQRAPLSSNGTGRPLPVPSTALGSGPQLNLPANVSRPSVPGFGPHSASVFSPQPLVSPPILSSTPSQITFGVVSGVVSTSGAQVPQPSTAPVSLSSAPSSAPISVSKMAPAPIVVRPPMPIPVPAQASVPVQHISMPAPPPAEVPKPIQLMPMFAPSSAPVPTLVQPNQSVTATVSSTASMPGYPPATSNTISAPAAAPNPLRPMSGDFTFQPLITQPPSSLNSLPLNNRVQSSQPVIFSAQRPASFRPALQSSMPLRPAQISPRPQQMQRQPLQPEVALVPLSAPVAPFPLTTINIRASPPMPLGYPNSNLIRPIAQVTPFGSPSFIPQILNTSGMMPTHQTHSYQMNQNQLHPTNQSGGTFSVSNEQLGGVKPIGFMVGNAQKTPGGNQIYDPFSPTASAAPTRQVANRGNDRKPETDAEYEDLMASVGVK